MANSGNLNHANASPKAYPGSDDSSADSRQTNQNKNASRTQATFNQRPSRRTIDRTTKARAIRDSHMSAGVLSISSMNGPRSQKPRKKRSHIGACAKRANAPGINSDKKLLISLSSSHAANAKVFSFQMRIMTNHFMSPNLLSLQQRKVHTHW